MRKSKDRNDKYKSYIIKTRFIHAPLKIKVVRVKGWEIKVVRLKREGNKGGEGKGVGGGWWRG